MKRFVTFDFFGEFPEEVHHLLTEEHRQTISKRLESGTIPAQKNACMFECVVASVLLFPCVS